jgi:nitrate reductase cytochrome c-type subunit
MKTLLAVILFLTSLFGNISDIPDDKSIEVKGKFARNKRCVRCHLDIYKEFKHSKHRHSNILNNPSHKVMWEGNPLSKEQKYLCAKCHAPAAENIDELISGLKVVTEGDKSIDDGISCAMCHRIKSIHPTDKGDKYVISKKKRLYYGTRESKQRSDFHKIKTDNPIFKNGDLCLTCHAQHKKQKLLITDDDKNEKYCVFSKVEEEAGKKALNSKKENCITCHMPQVEGSFTDRFSTNTHAYHGFAALNPKMENIKKYIDLNLTKKDNSFEISIYNKSTHELLLHPTRLFKLEIYINEKKVKTVEFKKESQAGVYKPFTWLKNRIIYKNNIPAKSKKTIKVDIKLKPEDKIRAVLGYHTFDPQLAEKIGFKDKKSLEYKILIDERF